MARDAPQQPSQRPQGRTDRTRIDSLTPTTEGTYFGRYRLVEEIGVGGMASVHLARMDGAGGFQKWVALKRVHPHLVEDEHFIKMFLDEARIAASISHPNVAQVFDLGSEGNTHWIAMEYLHGEPLRELMRHNMDIGRPMRPELAARIVADAAEGLHAAHELRGKNGEPLNLVHRDVTPHNLFVTYDGVVKVVDFGIAKVAGRLADTRAGTLKGKIAYMAPEQIKGREIDRRADIFALGVVLWELTTNRRLFRTDSDLETLERVQNCVVPPPSSVLMYDEYPVELEAIVMRALRRDRDERFASARELSRALQQYLMAAGEFIGPAEIGAYVSKVFAQRIAQREEHLRWAAEFTETFSADRPAPGSGAALTSSTATQPVESQDTHVDPPRAPRPGGRAPPAPPEPPASARVPRAAVRPTAAELDDDSRSTIDSIQTVVQSRRALIASAVVDDSSASTARMSVRDKEMLAQPPVSVSVNPATGLPRIEVGREEDDDDEEYIQTRVASAAGRQQQQSVMRAFDDGSSATLEMRRDDDPTRPMPSSSDPNVPVPQVDIMSGTDADIERMRPRWRLYASYILVFVVSAVTVFVLAALMLQARGDSEQPSVAASEATASALPQVPTGATAPEPDAGQAPALPTASSTPEAEGSKGASALGGSAVAPAVAAGYLTVVCAPACEHIVLEGRDLGPVASRVPTAPGQYKLTLRGQNGVVKVVPAIVVSGEHTMQHVSMY